MRYRIPIWLSLTVMSRVPSAKDVLEATCMKDGDIARKLAVNYGIETGQPAINRWRNGGEPNAFRVTIALLDMAGMLNTSGGRRSNVATAARPTDPLERLAEGLAQIAETQREILSRLPEPAAVPAAPRRAAPKRRAK